MLIDAHLDLAYNALNLARDLRVTVTEGRLRSVEHSAEWRRDAGTLTTTLPEIRAHMPAVVCGTIFVLPASAKTSLDGLMYTTPAEAREQALQQLGWYQQMQAEGHLQIITNRADLDALCDEPPPYGPPGLVLLMEGAECLTTPAELGAWAAAGLYIVGPAWQGTRYSGGTGHPGPLTPLGHDLLREMQQLGVALDASHLAEQSFWDALRVFDGPVAASHSNCRSLMIGSQRDDRYLSDDMIKAIVERDGVIGMVLHSRMIVPDWDGDKRSVTLDDLVRHIEHVCALAGDTLHVGIGSDLDGGAGMESIPAELNTWGDLERIGEALQTHGWAAADIANLLGGNWRRWLGRVLTEQRD